MLPTNDFKSKTVRCVFDQIDIICIVWQAPFIPGILYIYLMQSGKGCVEKEIDNHRPIVSSWCAIGIEL